MAKTTPEPIVEPIIESDELGEVTELDELRDENARLREEIDELRATQAPAAFTTDTIDRRQAQARAEQATMHRSEGARLDREQQENVARAEGRPIGRDVRDVRLADTPASAMREHDDEHDDE